MNFDIIEGLNEEQLQTLFDDTVVDGIEDGVQMGYCICSNGSGWGAAYSISRTSHFNYNDYTYCSLRLSDMAKCDTWCRRQGGGSIAGFSSNWFNTWCSCQTYNSFYDGGWLYCPD